VRELEPRAQRALGAVGLAVVVVAAVGAVYLRPWQWTPPVPGPAAARAAPAIPASVQQVQFLSPAVGWVVTDGPASAALFHTTDGGRHWQRQLEGVHGFDWTLRFFDAGHGVVYMIGRDGSPALWRTGDGGHHWARLTLPAPVPPHLVFFADPDHGWSVARPTLQVVFGPIVDRQDVVLFRTADGGATWAPVLATDERQPVSHGLGDDGQKTWIWFRDRSAGWIGQTNPGEHAVVYATTDGGEDWSRQELPAPGGDQAGAGTLTVPPIAFGRDGVALVEARIVPVSNGWTVQGGSLVTWQLAAAAWSAPTALPANPFSLGSLGTVDGRRWWAAAGPSVQMTDDAGAHWRPVGQAPAGMQFVELSLVDAGHAWAILVDTRSCTPWLPCRFTLARTADGGRHWSVVRSPA
jgi:photosystem II stability/assembly factor-like uncharacterized protein